jgi:hypothetical protein
MIRFSNKFFIALTISAFCFFLFISLGGEFFHHHIHHHQFASSYDDCGIFQLFAQAFLFLAAAIFRISKVCTYHFALVKEVVISRQKYLLPILRAPPIFV